AGDPAGAAEALLARAALAREAGDPDAPLRLAGAGQAALAAGLRDGGRWALREAIRAGLDREDAVAAWQALARLASSRGEGPAEREALVALAPLLPTGEKPAALLRLAALHEAAGDAGLAREAVEQARRLSPRDPAAVAASLAAAEKARDLPVVAERLDELATLEPASAGERLLERARLLAGPLAQPEAGDDELTRALALLPPSLALASEQVRLRRAAPPPVGERPWGEPLERFAARAASPAEAAAAWRDAAGLAQVQGDGGAALRCARAAWELTREEDATFAGPLWSRLLYREGGRDEALALHRHLFETALLRLDEREQARLCRRLAELAEEQGQPDLARAALARLAELRPLDADAALAAFRLEPDRAQAVRALSERAAAWRSVRSRVQAWSLAATAAHRELRDPTLADALWRRARGAAGDYPSLLAGVEEQRLQVARADHDPAGVGPPRELLEALRDTANARAASGDAVGAADLHQEAAALALGHGLTAEELQEREALCALRPGDAGLALDLCLAQARGGLHDDAVAGLRSWLAAHADDPRAGEALSALGRAHLALEEPEQAAAAALRRLERSRRLGLPAERRGALDDGCAVVERSPAPLQPDFLEQLAAALLDEGDARGDAMGERAVEALSRTGENARAVGLVALASRAATGARRAAWLVRLSDASRARGDREAAAAALGEAVAAAPDDQALRQAHLAQLEATGRPGLLARALEEALRAPGADRAPLLRRLAIAYREAGDAASAERAERELVGLGPETPGYREACDALERRFEERGELRALADLRLRRAQGAAQPAERALRYAAASEALLRAGAADEARAAAQQASDEDPDAQRPWQALAAVEEREGRRAQAAAAHLAAALRGEGTAAASEALEAARLFERAGQDQEAGRAYAAAAGAQPGNPEARRALARRAATAGDLKEVARQLSELDILLLPREERREHELELARAYSAAGMTEADDSWRQLFDSDAGDPEVFEVLASAARRTGANAAWLELAARHDGALAGGDSSRRRDLRGARAGLLEEMGQLEAAEGAWQASLSIDPEYRPALRALRRLAELRGDTTAAADLALREGSVAREPLEAAALFMEEGRLRRAANDLLRAAAAYERALARAEVVASPESFDLAAEARLGLSEVMPSGRLDEEVTEPVPREGLAGEPPPAEQEERHDLPRTEAPTLALDEDSPALPAGPEGVEISIEGAGPADAPAEEGSPPALSEGPPQPARVEGPTPTSTPALSEGPPQRVRVEGPTADPTPDSTASAAPAPTTGPVAAPAPARIEIPLEAPTLLEMPARLAVEPPAPTPLPLPRATPPPLPARTPPPLRPATTPPAAAEPPAPAESAAEVPLLLGEEELLPVEPDLEVASPAELASALELAIDKLGPESAPGTTQPDHPLPLPAEGAVPPELSTGLLGPEGGAVHSTLGLFQGPAQPPPAVTEPAAALDLSWELDPDPAAEERLQAFAARATGAQRADALAALGRRREQRGARGPAAEAFAAAAEADPPRGEQWLQELERLAGGEAERLAVHRLRVRLAQSPAARVAAMVSLAAALLSTGEGGRAEANEVLERALGLEPTNGPAAEALARLSIATGQAERALAILGPLEGGAPGLPPRTVLALQLEAARVAGDPALALERARRAARNAPMDAELQEWWARAAAEAQEPREEAEAWAAALSAAPRAAPEEEGHRRVQLAAALRRQGRDDEALRELLRAAERAPEVGTVLDAAAEALRAAGRGRDALVYGERAARLEPSALERRRRLGVLAQAAEALPDRGLALWLWEGARAAAPGDAEVLRALVRLHAQAGGDPAQLAGLARELEAAGGADGLGTAAAVAGRALAASGDEEAGFRFLSVAQHADPGDHVVLREVVQLAERLGRHVEMVALGEQLAEAEAQAGQAAAAAARLRTLAQVAHDRLGDGVSTARLLERAAELRPAGPAVGAAAPAEEPGGGLAGALQRARQNPADAASLAALAAASARAARLGGPDAPRHAARAQVAEALAAFLDPRLPAPQPPPLARRLTPDLQGRAALPLAAGATARLLALLAPWLEPLFPADLARRGVNAAHRLGPERAPALAARLAAAGRALGARPVVAFLSDAGGFEVALENTQPPSLVIGARVPRELRESAVDFLLSRALCLAGVGWALVGKFAPRDVGILCELACRFAGAAPPALGLPAERAGAFLDALGRLVPVAVRERASTFAADAAAELRNLPPRELQLALRRTAARQALVWSGDPLGALEGLVTSRPGGDAIGPAARAQALADADVADLASFALSDSYLELRLAVGAGG
ncbi:MAG: hypothetical protein HZB56_01910, partial [Deltaproteobacteria bacterium]|nr:hypothetical protein [Deltaproteobacteria bacterium]